MGDEEDRLERLRGAFHTYDDAGVLVAGGAEYSNVSGREPRREKTPRDRVSCRCGASPLVGGIDLDQLLEDSRASA